MRDAGPDHVLSLEHGGRNPCATGHDDPPDNILDRRRAPRRHKTGNSEGGVIHNGPTKACEPLNEIANQIGSLLDMRGVTVPATGG